MMIEHEYTLNFGFNALLQAVDNFKHQFWRSFVNMGFIGIYANLGSFSPVLVLVLIQILQNVTFYAGHGELAYLIEHRIGELLMHFALVDDEPIRIAAYRCISNFSASGGRYMDIWIETPDFIREIYRFFESRSFDEKISIIEMMDHLCQPHTILKIMEIVDLVEMVVLVLLGRKIGSSDCFIDILTTALHALLDQDTESLDLFCSRLESEGVLEFCDDALSRGSEMSHFIDVVAFANEVREHLFPQ
jgi:hypothetical protein